jgi:sulfide:quinone oxidoreductase
MARGAVTPILASMGPRERTGKRFSVVVAGGGVAALEAALVLRELAADLVDVELVAPEPRFWYRPAAVGEPFGLAAVRSYDLADLAGRAGASFTPGALEAVDAGTRLMRTESGAAIPFDALLLARGADPIPAVKGAITFRGPRDSVEIERVLHALDRGEAQRVVFAVPAGAAWSLPLYELALMTGAYVANRRLDVELMLVTPEDRPLSLFGGDASDAVAELLSARRVEIRTGVYPVAFEDGLLSMLPDGGVPADHVVALPRLYVPPIGGIPQTYEGFVPVDRHGHVPGLSGVWAAGDVTSFPVKQGGIATQQADAAAESIAAAAGAAVRPSPFRPVLRGLLLTGGAPRFLRGDPATRGEASLAATEPLWWPPAKIVGRHLAPFLARLDPGVEEEERGRAGAVAVDVELDEGAATPMLPPAPAVEGDELSAGEVCSSPLVTDPEDTVAEVAAALLAHRRDAALIVEDGELVGIVTTTDLLHAVADRVRCGDVTVRGWMTAEPVTVDADASLAEAAHLLTLTGLSRLVVVEDGRPAGILSRAQLERHGVPVPVGLGF